MEPLFSPYVVTFVRVSKIIVIKMSFIAEVIEWYGENKRDLPWRKTKDPYIIWLSEIILQQTRVEQGLPYFQRFAERFPTVADFAHAEEGEIMKLWQGLGYYSRGRIMHHTANMVMEAHGGYFPQRYDELIKLKGIGEYTAAAIASFSSNEAKAVVDGNIFRLLSRFFGIDEPINSSKAKKVFIELANEIIDPEQPGISNQSMMEFGSLLCRPYSPDCGICPVRSDCFAFKHDRVNQLPVKLKKTVQRERHLNYLVISKENQILLNKRGPKDIWENLYEFPLLETPLAVKPIELVQMEQFQLLFGKNVKARLVEGPVKHVLSHQKLFANFVQLENIEERFNDCGKSWFYADIQELNKHAMPKLIFAFLNKFSTLISSNKT